MDADTPRNRRGRPLPLPRATDYARLLLGKAQLALAVLAVPVSMTVGIVVAGSDHAAPGTPAASPAVAMLRTASDLVSRVELLPATPGTVAGLARADEIAREPAPGPPDVQPVNGLLAGLCTLGSCWVALAVAGTMWRRRLDERDLRDWSDGWARVEPLWSDRPL